MRTAGAVRFQGTQVGVEDAVGERAGVRVRTEQGQRGLADASRARLTLKTRPGDAMPITRF